MTAFTTVPFFTVPSGEVSLTAAVTMSPRPAFLPNPPPSGKITCSLRAPELSATASMVLICSAMGSSPYSLALVGSGHLRRNSSVFDLAERRTPDNLFQSPPLQLAQRTGLANAHHIAHPRRALLVVGIELLGGSHDLFVLGMRLAHFDLDHNGLLHLGRNHIANLLIAPRASGRRRLCCVCCRRHLAGSFCGF